MDKSTFGHRPRELEFGYFYELYFGERSEFLLTSSTDNYEESKQTDRPWIWQKLEAHERIPMLEFSDLPYSVYSSSCPRHEEHLRRPERPEFGRRNGSSGLWLAWWMGGTTETGIVELFQNHEFFCITHDLLKKLIAAEDLTGWSVSAIQVVIRERRLAKVTAPAPFFELLFMGRSCLSPRVISPNTANRCPWCGRGPLSCSECGEWFGRQFRHCHRCRRDVFASECEGSQLTRKEWHDFPDALVAPIPPESKPKFGSLLRFSDDSPISSVDPARWDGSDFFSGNIVTRRVVDWLLSLHVRPFIAKPIAVDVLNISDTDRERLERAKRPVTGKVDVS